MIVLGAQKIVILRYTMKVLSHVIQRRVYIFYIPAFFQLVIQVFVHRGFQAPVDFGCAIVVFPFEGREMRYFVHFQIGGALRQGAAPFRTSSGRQLFVTINER